MGQSSSSSGPRGSAVNQSTRGVSSSSSGGMKSTKQGFIAEAAEPLVQSDFVASPESTPIYAYGSNLIDNRYGTRPDAAALVNSDAYDTRSSLLDPGGQLSDDLRGVLDQIFTRFGSSLLMRRSDIIAYVKACYPAFTTAQRQSQLEQSNRDRHTTTTSTATTAASISTGPQTASTGLSVTMAGDDNSSELVSKVSLSERQKHGYVERGDYLLDKYGRPFAEYKQQLRLILESSESNQPTTSSSTTESKKSKKRKLTIKELKGMRRTQRDADNSDNTDAKNADVIDEEKSETEYNRNKPRSMNSLMSRSKQAMRRMKKYSLMSINEDIDDIQSTLQLSIPDDEIVLPKTQFFLYYRKTCVDRPMLARLELVALGFDRYQSSLLVDRSKSVDLLAFKVQQMRNQRVIHTEEKDRISQAKSSEECAKLIASYIQNHQEPLDANDGHNTFRRRKPFKFGCLCWVCCPCVPMCAKCCCE